MDSDPFQPLIDLIARLRGENGCPWDRKQTPRTVEGYLIEEAHELASAIRAGDPSAILEELGDVLFQVFFIAHLFAETETFDISDVVRRITGKMVRRHPHVFGDAAAEDDEAVRREWQAIKLAEKAETDPDSSLLDSVPKTLPALIRAYRISERAGRIGFDWDDRDGVMDQVEREWGELKAALAEADGRETDAVAMEFGDVLLTLVNLARFLKVHPETALSDAVDKFETRFRHMEGAARQRGKLLPDVERDDMERLWDAAKADLDGSEAG